MIRPDTFSKNRKLLCLLLRRIEDHVKLQDRCRSRHRMSFLYQKSQGIICRFSYQGLNLTYLNSPILPEILRCGQADTTSPSSLYSSGVTTTTFV